MTEADAGLVRIRRYAHWLDSGIRIPGTTWRIGFESLLGLLPGFGDAAGAALSAWIFIEAARRGATAATLTRMGVNIAIDALAGAVPVLGDLFDFGWKANLRNVALLERMAAEPGTARRADRTFVALVSVAVGVLCAVPILGGLALLLYILSLIAAR